MWNWKLMYEDEESLWYCDIDSISDSEEDEDGVFRSADCYQPITRKAAMWTSIFFKSNKKVVQYVEQRRKEGLTTEGYQDFNNVLCVVEIDLEKQKYRVIPAVDYDKAGGELSQSTLLDDETASVFPGVRNSWSKIQPRKTHKAVRALYSFVRP
jgi:hypothetical protein